MKKKLITLGGPPGSGKSTVGRILAKKLGYAFFSTGEYARQLGIERGLTIESFNELVAKDKSIDEEIDAAQKRIEAEEEEYVIDAHLGFHFVPSSFKVYLDISLEESARRILGDKNAEIRKKSGDTMETFEEALNRTEKRIENHMERYVDHYGVNPYDTSHYDLVIDSTNARPEDIADTIMVKYTEWLNEDT